MGVTALEGQPGVLPTPKSRWQRVDGGAKDLVFVIDDGGSVWVREAVQAAAFTLKASLAPIPVSEWEDEDRRGAHGGGARPIGEPSRS